MVLNVKYEYACKLEHIAKGNEINEFSAEPQMSFWRTGSFSSLYILHTNVH